VHPAFGTDTPLTSEEIVSVLLEGIRRDDHQEPSC
jgi:hypothetical protein